MRDVLRPSQPPAAASFLTIEPKGVFAPVRQKAMPVILKTPKEIDILADCSLEGGKGPSAAAAAQRTRASLAPTVWPRHGRFTRAASERLFHSEVFIMEANRPIWGPIEHLLPAQ